MAILPFSKNNFSFVWSVDKEFVKKDINSVVKSKICKVLKTNKIQIESFTKPSKTNQANKIILGGNKLKLDVKHKPKNNAKLQ